MVRTKLRGGRAAAPERKRPEKKKAKRTVQQSGHDDESDEERILGLAADAEEMAEDDGGSYAFLSNARLPKIQTADARVKEKERLAAQRRREREALKPEVVEHAESDVSTDMEGLSESEDDVPDIDVASDDEIDSDDEPADQDEGESDAASQISLEDAYMARSSKKERRAEMQLQKERERLAHRRLPIRAADGEIVEADSVSEDDMPQSRAVFDEIEEEEEEEEPVEPKARPTSTVTHSARFGMLAPHDIVVAAEEDPNALIQAREQIASLSSQIVGDPEMSMGLLRRLAVFAQSRIEPPPETVGEKRKRDRPVVVHPYIRQLALVSLLAVFVDILPGYRIRALSEKEEKERVGQEVARRREWEQSLVTVYRDYLALLEIEARKSSSPLAPVALKCFCTLLTRASHFNFRKNIVATVVAHLSRKEWNDASKQCFDALVQFLKKDNDGEASLEVVQLLYRMIRERHFLVHANVLDILAHLRLREELTRTHKTGPMGSAHAAPTPRVQQKNKVDSKRVRKGLAVHRSKKETKRARELEAIEQEMREADAVINLEERERNQSETLKLVFALYFRILKTSETPQQLLASALQGIVLFAHHVSVDFFRDLIQVLRTLLGDAMRMVEQASAWHEEDIRAAPVHKGMRGVLLCIVAAFELLKGQGESLQVDVGDFFVALYQLLPYLSMSTCFEEEETNSFTRGMRSFSEADLLFRALDLSMVKVPRQAVNMSVERTAAIVKRLLTASLHWPTPSVLRTLKITHSILGRVASVDTRIEALLDTRETVRDGQYDPYARNPESARVLAAGEAAWELFALAHTHANSQVRETAAALLDWTP
ncbi:hypothetical protein MCUN1_002798 [Malassezia cuniculi]|uniref:Nucleolar complex-associated protein 3 n=1 Tax=Malassezia cuniculi TaxID=948313 RepID=A0AAF0EWB3_9BASI|nr:hypothetical protein MCUN1_002798 [Malassezia cuniculi]